MSYTTRTIGTKTVLQDDRLLVVKEGDVYLEYKVYDGPLS